VFHRLPGVRVSGYVIFFAMMYRGSLMSVRGKVVQLCGPPV
jgi:hypothetical protein